MQIKSLKVKNLRGLRELDVSIAPLTALIGGNNAGKSTILKAIELFFDSAPKLTREDFSAGAKSESIEITIQFNKLTPVEVAEFGSAVVQNELAVTRHLSLEDKDSGQYSAVAFVCPDFQQIREESNGTKKAALYRALGKNIGDLPAVKTAGEISDALARWEAANPARCSATAVRGFFGAPNVANGKLRKKTSVHLVPAVRDAGAETVDPKRSPIITLLGEISRQTFENKTEITEFADRTRREFEELADPANVPQLAGISATLTDSIQRFYSDSKLSALWQKSEGVTLTYPTPRIVVDHAGIVTDIARVGHGLQRAVLFSIVQFLAEQRSVNDRGMDQIEFQEPASDIIVLVEEPEIYQHPSKQMVIYSALKRLTQGFNKATGIRLQVVYTTHSEKFVSMSEFDIARIVRRRTVEEKTTNVVSNLSIDVCRTAFANYLDPPRTPMSAEAFVAKLHIFTREVCEGFFASKIVLVEGLTDRAVLEAAFRERGRDIHQESISIISVEGKTKMDKPAYIFSRLGIPTYLLFDNDLKKAENKRKQSTNILLQKVCGVAAPENWPSGCHNNFTAIEGNLEDYLREQLGDTFNVLFRAVATDFDLDYEEIKKTPAAMSSVFTRARALQIEFPLFDEIILKIDELE